MPEPTKIDFHHRRISRLSDFTDLVEMLFPGNRNQQHAAACIFLELKRADGIVPSLTYIEAKYTVSRRILQRARAKLSRLGLIEHVSYLNSRYGGQHGWRLSRCFERALVRLAKLCAQFKSARSGTQEKDQILIEFTDAQRHARSAERTSNVCTQ
jgi:hypothetical protein